MAGATQSLSDIFDGAERPQSRFSRFAERHPITAFSLGAFGIGWPVLAVPAITGIPTQPFLFLLTWLGLLGSAVVVTRATGGPGAVRRLLSRVLIWRFNLGRWAVILLGMPVLTVALAAGSGTLETPDGGWAPVAATYLSNTFLVAALINLWEETAWGGFVQSRLMHRHGLLVGSVLTAVPFAFIHLPLQFESGWTWSDVAVGFALLVAATPFYRYLLGVHFLATGGSVLAIAIQHSSWNAAGKLDGVSGEWQAAAAVLLTLLVALAQRLMHGGESSSTALDAGEASAAESAPSPPLVSGSRAGA